ncbi:MAG: hypothetical protein H7343_15975 [Undibacterium sp.]|nr:hypothetical protein [Opitutaceae bacterium]
MIGSTIRHRFCNQHTARKTLNRHHSGRINRACPATIDVNPQPKSSGGFGVMKTAKLSLS